jgi:hypothetical protein
MRNHHSKDFNKMKIVRIIAGLLFFIVLVTVGLSFMLPTYQKVERSIEINASPHVIYQQLIKLENFNRFSVWTQSDSSAVYTLSGTDGKVGAATSWKGSPEISGEGKIEIVELVTDKKVAHKFQLTKPKKINAESVFTLTQTNKEKTTVTWTFKMATPRPWNIFNIVYSVDKELGKDFEDGLMALKSLIELNKTAPNHP